MENLSIWKEKRIAALTSRIVAQTIERTEEGICPECDEAICRLIQLDRAEAIRLRHVKVRRHERTN
jgi:hypothetical protein